MQHFQIISDSRRIGANFLFQGFRYKKSKILLHLFILIEWQLLLFKN